MDQLPKLPMLYFDLKQSSNLVDFKTSFQKRILEIYSQDASNFINEIQEFEVLRSNAIRVTHDLNGCMLLKRYYAQLSIINNKFHYTSRSCDLKFTWTDTFTKSNVTGDIQLELDSILHNIGALHSELGAIGLRTTSESIKVACTHFQCAAWVFKKLKENTHFKSKDLSQDIMAFDYHIMLAQAQECFLEKSILDKRKPSIVSKIAAEVVSNYDYLIVILVEAEIQEKDSLYNKLFKEWRKFFEFKISFYSAICSYYMGLYDEIKMGERVAWLQSANEKLKSSVKLAKLTDRSNVIESVDYLVNLVKKALDQAKQDNDFIYHDLIPTQDKLTAIKGVSLVKEIGFSVSDPEVMGKDIFSRLVPIEAYETISIYSDNRDKMWREIKAKIDDKNEELVKFLSIIQLDKDNVRQRKFNVPEKLAQICATLNSSSTNFLDDVKERLEKLDELCKEVDEQFKELEKIILSEEEHEKTKSNKTTAIATNSISNLKNEFYRNYEVHKSAMQSNQDLHDVIKTNEKDIELLMKSSVQDLERLFSMNAQDLMINEGNLAELERLFDKIDEMKKQRAFLENKLKQSIKNDDILKSVVAHSESEIKSVFEKENQKFDVDLKYLEMNMSAQDAILNALTKANADYAETRKAFIDLEKLRNEKIESLYESYENVQGVLVNLDKGIEFYANLKQVIQQLRMKITKHIENRKSNDLKNQSSISAVTGDSMSLPSTTSTTSLDKNNLTNSIPPAITSNNHNNNNNNNKNIPSFDTKTPSKLKDFLPAYYDSMLANQRVGISNTNLTDNLSNSIQSTNLPTNLPTNQVLNTISNSPNYSTGGLQPTNLPLTSMSVQPPNTQQLSNQLFTTTNPSSIIQSKPITPSMNYPPATGYPTANMYNLPPYSNYGGVPPTSAYANPTRPTYYQQPNLPNQTNPMMLSNTITPTPYYSQPPTSNVSSSALNNYPPQSTTTAYQNGNYYMQNPQSQQQYLPPSTVYYSSQPTPTPSPQLPSNQPHPHNPHAPLIMPPANQPQNLHYGLQNLSLNNDNYQQPNYNYSQQQTPLQPPIQHQPVQQPKPIKPTIPVDSLLNSDNNLSEDVQPVLQPQKILNPTNNQANEETSK